MRNNLVISGLIAADYYGSGQGDIASDLEPGIILGGSDESSCLTHIRTTFVSICLKKLILIVSVMGVSRKVIILETSVLAIMIRRVMYTVHMN